MPDIFHTLENRYHQQLRILGRDGSCWLVLADVPALLGYVGSSDVPDFRAEYVDFYRPEELDAVGLGSPGIQIIPFGYFCELVFGCQKPGSRWIKDWVIESVVPEISAMSVKSPTRESQPLVISEESGNTRENGVMVFKNGAFGSVRSIIKDSEPWFVARDVAIALGYANPQEAVLDHCNYAKIFKGSESLLFTDSPRGINIIPESDVYALIFRSNLPAADKFRRWVCEEVLPSIRKTGKYAVKQEQQTDWETLREKITAMKILLDEADASKNARLIVLGRLIREETGFDALVACHMNLSRPFEEPALSTAQIAELMGRTWNEDGVLFNLTQMGLLIYSRREYELTSEGRKYGVELPPRFVGRGRRKKAVPGFAWKPIVADLIRIHLGMAHCPCAAPANGQLSL